MHCLAGILILQCASQDQPKTWPKHFCLLPHEGKNEYLLTNIYLTKPKHFYLSILSKKVVIDKKLDFSVEYPLHVGHRYIILTKSKDRTWRILTNAWSIQKRPQLRAIIVFQYSHRSQTGKYFKHQIQNGLYSHLRIRRVCSGIKKNWLLVHVH